MKNISKKRIEEFVKGGSKEKYSHALIYLDHWDYEYSFEYVERGQSIKKRIENIKAGGSPGMFTIEEVYNYDLDLDEQLNEDRAYHIDTPKINKQKNKTNNESNITNNKGNMVDKALKFATEKHKGQYRKGKDKKEYITHPIDVANLVIKYKGNSHNIDVLVAASYLHDTIEDTSTTYVELIENFGTEVASLVLELTSDKELKKEIGKTKYLCIKMKNMSDWALVIKLCDRLSNISGLADTDREFRIKYLKETSDIMKYLLDNRKLTNTQKNIVRDIINLLFIIVRYEYSNDSEELLNVSKMVLQLNEK